MHMVVVVKCLIFYQFFDKRYLFSIYFSNGLLLSIQYIVLLNIKNKFKTNDKAVFKEKGEVSSFLQI